jgi:formamidopyrimidine-DNA glycosylase
MPELPEVETIARGLANSVTGEVIESVWLGQKKEPLKSPASQIALVLEQSRITEVRRMGKHIVFDLDRGEQMARSSNRPRSKTRRKGSVSSVAQPADTSATVAGLTAAHANAQWIVHLGMTGRLQVCDPETEIAKHTHAILKLSSNRELRFVDPRRFGRLSVSLSADFSATGVEPLEVDLDRFVELFRGRKTPIKSALLNQRLLRGVGNIYADESLFRAGIRPRRRARSITQEQLKRLNLSIQEVLNEAIALGGSSVSDYVNADGEEGFFQLQHRVYGRQGEPCLVCKTPIKRVLIAGRSSHYCPKCQK